MPSPVAIWCERDQTVLIGTEPPLQLPALDALDLADGITAALATPDHARQLSGRHDPGYRDAWNAV